MKKPDFDTYDHSTSVASEKVRAVMKAVFTDAFDSRSDELRILDLGCGLGFLSCVSAEFYKDASITGIDTSEHASLRRSNLDGAKENARISWLLGQPAEKFNIIVSTSCFITLGRCDTRLTAFHRGSVIIGDLFFSPKTDIAHLEKAFRILRRIKHKNGFRDYALLLMSRDSHGLS